jgi:hypothetical protein
MVISAATITTVVRSVVESKTSKDGSVPTALLVSSVVEATHWTGNGVYLNLFWLQCHALIWSGLLVG